MNRRAGVLIALMLTGSAQAEDKPARRFEAASDAVIADGRVTVKGKNRSRLTATFKDGIPVGQIDLAFDDGSTYQGQLQNGLFDGFAYLKLHDGTQYEGDFKAGLFDGEGTLLAANGDQYEGTWKGGRREGQGSMLYAVRDRYVGTWSNGARTGSGSMSYFNGDRYDGTWKAGKHDGAGSLRYANGGVIKGTWDRGAPEGAVEVTYARTNRQQLVNFKQGVAQGNDSPLSGIELIHSPEDGRRSGEEGLKPRKTSVKYVMSPTDLSYPELSLEQKRWYKAYQYGPMEDEDEPPFLIGGFGGLYDMMQVGQNKAMVDGELYLKVSIDSAGNPTGVASAGKASVLVPLAAHMLARAKWKPAMCAGQPCAMDFFQFFKFHAVKNF